MIIVIESIYDAHDRQTNMNGEQVKTRMSADDARNQSRPTSLTPRQLGDRWGIKIQALANMRYRGSGPVFMKLGGSIRYNLTDVEAYEVANRFQRTDQPA